VLTGVFQVLNYDEFISKPLSNSLALLSLHSNGVSPAVSCDDEAERDVQIAILNSSISGIGPQQCDILQALTSSSANDILNLERLETLGDSFLKLMSSLYLFRRYELVNEGKLTCIKGKLVGNRNLYYIGDARKLGGLMKVGPCVRSQCSLFETSLRVHTFVFSRQRCGRNVLCVL
jgi:endoribonuclease Dicer